MQLLLHGPDSYRSRQQFKKLIKDFQAKRDPGGMNTVVFDSSKDIDPTQILEAMTASPFLAEKRMVAIEKLSAFKNQEFFDTLLELLENKKIPESTVLLVWEEVLPEKKKHKIFDWLAKQKYSQFFGQLNPKELSKWIMDEAKKNKVEIDKRALDFLISHPLAQDMWIFSSELNKLFIYASQLDTGRVTLKEIELLFPPVVDENVFHLVDALLAKNNKLATKLLYDQWAEGSEEPAVFGTIVWQFRTLLELKDCVVLNPRSNSDALAAELGIHPFVVRKSLGVLGKFSLDQLKTIYKNLLEIDIKVKTGEGDLKTLLDLFVAKVCN